MSKADDLILKHLINNKIAEKNLGKLVLGAIVQQSHRLRSPIKLSESFVPPVEGLDGLLGKVQNVAQKKQDGSNDKWAWG